MNFIATHDIINIEPNASAAGTFTLAAGTTDVNSTPVDLSAIGAEGGAFVVLAGAMAASSDMTITVEHSADGTNYFACEGASLAWADTDDYLMGMISFTRPKAGYRYVRLATNRGTGGNSAIDRMFFVANDLRRNPPAYDTSGAGQYVAAPTVLDALETAS